MLLKAQARWQGIRKRNIATRSRAAFVVDRNGVRGRTSRRQAIRNTLRYRQSRIRSTCNRTRVTRTRARRHTVRDRSNIIRQSINRNGEGDLAALTSSNRNIPRIVSARFRPALSRIGTRITRIRRNRLRQRRRARLTTCIGYRNRIG